MSLPRNFDERLAGMEDFELFDMFARSGEYLPEALDSARREISNRGLDSGTVANLRTAAREKLRVEEEATAKLNRVFHGGFKIHILIAIVGAGLKCLRDLLIG